MGILKIKLTNADGQPVVDQTVNVTGAGPLQTNAAGLAQFLVDSDQPLDVEIGGVLAWSGNAALLAREEVFQQLAAGFVRIT